MKETTPTSPNNDKKPISEPVMKVVPVTIPVLLDIPTLGYEVEQARSGQINITDRVHLNLHLGKTGSITFLDIRNALRINNAKVGDGKPVYSNSDTIRWLIDQVVNQTSNQARTL